MEEILKCKLCANSYNNENLEPLIIRCGHTYCKTCLFNKKSYINCPICGVHVSYKIEECLINAIVIEMLMFLQYPKSNKIGYRSHSKSDRKISEIILNRNIIENPIVKANSSKILKN